ncbi:PHB depolymerase family esterase [Sulfitobacter sp. LCG007]
MRLACALGVLAITLAGAGRSAAGCGPDPAPCTVPLGVYHVALPEGKPRGALLYLHGARASGKDALQSRDWNRMALSRGYAVIAPDGTIQPVRGWRGWSFMLDIPTARDEIAFLESVRDDAAARFGLDAGSMILTGFSVGGAMTSYVACRSPESFAAYAPVAGGFWRPHPGQCEDGPVRLLHTHGWTDTTVPLEGRVLRGEDEDDPDALMQGDIYDTLEMWRHVNGCKQFRADRFVTEGAFLRRAWDRCTPGSALEFALHKGGHLVPEGWATMMLDWAETLEAADRPAAN